jgi:hypothetical protein
MCFSEKKNVNFGDMGEILERGAFFTANRLEIN